MNKPDAVTEIDLDAYVDDQLDPQRRIEVEEYLSSHGDDAMRIMADLRIRDALRYTMHSSTSSAPPIRTIRLAQRLERAQFFGRLYSKLRPVAATLLLLIVGWMGHVGYSAFSQKSPETIQALPTFVDDAIRAHRVSLIRASMLSQPEVPVIDAAEILDNLGIVLPKMPDDWQLKDVQVFPSSAGPGLEIVLETGNSGSISIFVSRTSLPNAVGPIHSRYENSNVVYWQRGPWSYAMTSEAPEIELAQLASRLTFEFSPLH